MILHVDMDAFYASIEQRDFPELRGLPVLVGSSKGRGVVAAASYEARKFGCRSAMPMKEALRRCPDAIVRSHRFSVYRQIAEQIQLLFHEVTPLVEPLSLDEAFLDVTDSVACLGSAEEIGRRLKARIREETGLVASVGLAPVKFLAKLASDHGKPDGFVVIRRDEILDFLAPLPVGRLWGVGKATLPRLRGLGIERVADLRKFTAEFLEAEFGSQGRHLWELAHGIDPRSVVAERTAKSISHEETYEEDRTDEEGLLASLHALTDEVCLRLRKEGVQASSVNLKLRFANFQTITRQTSCEAPTDQTRIIWEKVRDLWTQASERRGRSIRLLGVGLSGLVRSEARQPSLFEDPLEEKDRRVDRTMDEIRRRFGIDSVRPADSLRRPDRS